MSASHAQPLLRQEQGPPSRCSFQASACLVAFASLESGILHSISSECRFTLRDLVPRDEQVEVLISDEYTKGAKARVVCICMRFEH